jgi:hypothetical protein
MAWTEPLDNNMPVARPAMQAIARTRSGLSSGRSCRGRHAQGVRARQIRGRFGTPSNTSPRRAANGRCCRRTFLRSRPCSIIYIGSATAARSISSTKRWFALRARSRLFGERLRIESCQFRIQRPFHSDCDGAMQQGERQVTDGGES